MMRALLHPECLFMPLSHANVPALALTLRYWASRHDLPSMHRNMAQSLSVLLSYHGEEDSAEDIDWLRFRDLACYLCQHHSMELTGEPCHFGLNGPGSCDKQMRSP